mmetsp:Transcript_93166/g.162931  ORF Transcript_93166/g.162931 Transcript_93166/m.162931 type:complete len:113 (+) Transcript_93166:79-417(+)
MGNPTDDNTSFNSQPTYVVQYTPSKGAPYFIYMADDWVHCPNSDGTEGPLINSCYTWLPINFHQDHVTIEWRPAWDFDDPFALESVSNWTTTSTTTTTTTTQKTLLWTHLFL